ncbi:MAG: hypothetical protein M3463_18020 [Verrucomicrobiota bacterium]|nr:hypothetical protein [Verrucomicrobiota bacterium]
MKRLLLALLAMALSAAPAAAAPPSDDEVLARKTALDVAGAFSNDGFKLRDGHWLTTLQPGKSHVVQVHLFAGNEYWFSLGATPRAKRIAVSVFDEKGQPLAYEPYVEGATAAAGFAPEASGPYLVKVAVLEGDPSAVCLLYSYK